MSVLCKQKKAKDSVAEEAKSTLVQVGMMQTYVRLEEKNGLVLMSKRIEAVTKAERMERIHEAIWQLEKHMASSQCGGQIVIVHR